MLHVVDLDASAQLAQLMQALEFGYMSNTPAWRAALDRIFGAVVIQDGIISEVMKFNYCLRQKKQESRKGCWVWCKADLLLS